LSSITTWTRVEPWPHDELASGLQAKVYDAAWFLARQWQLGEFAGEDAASPAHLSIEVQTAPIQEINVGGASVAVGSAPLDAVIGAEPRRAMNELESAEAGAELLRCLVAHGCSDACVKQLLDAYAFAPIAKDVDAVGAHFLSLLEDRFLDAARLEELLQETQQSGKPPGVLGIPPEDSTAFVKAAKEWVSWLDSIEVRARPRKGATATPEAWRFERLEHRFSACAEAPGQGRFELICDDWHGERLDWYHFDSASASVLSASVDPLLGIPSIPVVPTHLSYPGMPVARFWQFEDARVNFAKVECDTRDLARMLAVGFACAYSNDWYICPITLPVGALHMIRSLKVTDTFGEVVVLDPFGEKNIVSSAAPHPSRRDFALFRSTVRETATGELLNGLLLAPAMDAMSSDPVERVRFFRDEMANLAWAIEAAVAGADGRALERSGNLMAPDAGAAQGGSLPPDAADAPLFYTLASEVPPHWLALVLEVDAPQFSLRGLWTARRKVVGQGGGSSGLRFDQIAPAAKPR
jgi:hypothetical protein